MDAPNKKRNSRAGSVFDLSMLNVSIDNKCVVCYDLAPDSVFLKCGHAGLCYECGLDMWEQSGSCYLCRDVQI